ncbi:hypothetical protein OUZ56_032987 [Daphnia magna]|uniref:Uncharacterized protein n=1 Tax=Daphnia magna TaxID=35525 RepID=A0ABR0B9X5_9CRUS|nr:hypothetical protein OUZ56_032987 [Daphnia magna]
MQKTLSLGWFHGQNPQYWSTTVSLTVEARDRTFEADLQQISTLPCLPKELMEIRSRYFHLKDVKLVDAGEPTFLIEQYDFLYIWQGKLKKHKSLRNIQWGKRVHFAPFPTVYNITKEGKT